MDVKETLEKMGDNVWEHDFDTRTTSFSKNLEPLLGYQLEHHPDKELFWWSIVHPADKYLLEKNDEAYKSGMLSNHSVEYRVRHKDGTFKWIHDRGVVILKSPTGKPRKIIGTHSDISTRKAYEIKLAENERRFTDLAKNVPGVIYQRVEDMLGASAFTYVSPRLKEYFGIEPVNMNTLIEYVHPEDVLKWRASVEESRETGLPWKFEGRLLYPDGVIRWFRGQSVLSEKDERGIVYNGIMTDMTEEMNLRQAIEKKEKENKLQVLKAVIDAQENERQAISYELHDNVNQVLATTKLLIGLVDPRNPKTYTYLNQGTENIQMMMDEIRNISHGLNSSMLNFVGLEGGIRDLLQKINDTRAINFTAEIPMGFSTNCLDKEVELTVFRIIQAQVNNILKHSKASEASVSITGNNSRIIIIVHDNGIGFDVNTESFGLGLTNIRNRVEIFDGKVELTSAPGNGCTLTVRIPLTGR